MKKRNFLCAVFLLPLCFGHLDAQELVLTERSHGLGVDAVNEMFRASYVDPGPAGVQQEWDLSGMEKTRDFLGFTAAAVEADPQGSIPGANVVLNEEGNQFFFCQEDAALKARGMMTAGGRVLMQFHTPYIKMKYPFCYGDEFSGKYEGSYFPGDGREVPLAGSYHVTADGQGRLILPGGKVLDNTLRVKSVRSYDIMLGDTPLGYHILTYRWYTHGERFPVAVLISTESTACGNGSTSYQAAYKIPANKAAAKWSAGQTDADMRIFPNPVSRDFSVQFRLEADAKVKLALFDSKGKLITMLVDRPMRKGSYEEHFNADEYALKPGIYFIRSNIGESQHSLSFIRQR